MHAFRILALLTAAAVAPSGAASAASFDPSLTVRGASARTVGEPAVAITNRGAVGIAYVERVGRTGLAVIARRGTLSQPVGRAETLTSHGDSSSIARNDAATGAIWTSSRRGGIRMLHARIATDTGGFGRTQTLIRVKANVTSARILPLGADRFVAVWWQGVPGERRHAVRYAVAGAGRTFGKVREMAADTGNTIGVSAASQPDGGVLFTWGVSSIQSPEQLHSAVLAANRTTVRRNPPISATTSEPGVGVFGEVAAGGPGGSSLAWTERRRVLTSIGGAPPMTIATLDAPGFALGPALSLPGAGSPLAAWAVVQDDESGESYSSGSVFAASRQPDGTFGAARTLSASSDIAADPGAAGTARLAIVTWATGQFPAYSLRYTIRDAAGTFGPARTLSPSAQRAVALAGASAGAIAAWSTGGPGDRQTLRVAVLRDR